MIKRNVLGNYKIHKTNTTDIIVWSVLLVYLVGTFIFLNYYVIYKWDMFRPDLLFNIIVGYLQFHTLPLSEMLHIISLLIATLALGFMTTVFGAVMGLFFGLLASTNVSNPSLASAIKGFAGLIRSVDTIIWVLILISGFGLTATTAVLGMTFHSLAFFIKSYSEAFEEVDKGTIEALRSTGASTLNIITSALIPSAYTKLLAWIALRSEINFAVAVVIGPAVGVPGTIGSAMNSYTRTANYTGLGFSAIAIVIVAYAFEVFLSRIKEKEA